MCLSYSTPRTTSILSKIRVQVFSSVDCSVSQSFWPSPHDWAPEIGARRLLTAPCRPIFTRSLYGYVERVSAKGWGSGNSILLSILSETCCSSIGSLMRQSRRDQRRDHHRPAMRGALLDVTLVLHSWTWRSKMNAGAMVC